MEKQKDKLRDIANKRNLVGERNPFYGFKHTEDAKKKMSKSHKGKTTWNKGIPMKLESKEKSSLIATFNLLIISINLSNVSLLIEFL